MNIVICENNVQKLNSGNFGYLEVIYRNINLNYFYSYQLISSAK